jgi:hypothetical protein
MEIFTSLLFWLHLMGLALGGASAFGNPVVGSRLVASAPEGRIALFPIAHGLSRLGKIGMSLLIITGLLMVWLRFGGPSGLSPWFWLKMALLVLLLVDIIYISRLEKRAEAGDDQVLRSIPKFGALGVVLLLGIVLSAVLSFG